MNADGELTVRGEDQSLPQAEARKPEERLNSALYNGLRQA
jgi:hypothetical protein